MRHDRALISAGCWSRRYLIPLLAVLGSISVSLAADATFPFDHELRLDAAPLRGTKRVPALQISEKGAVDIDLWCVSGKGQAAIVENAITIMPISMRDNQCSPDQLRRDEDLLGEIMQVTNWQRQGDVVVLSGAKALKFRMSTN